MFDIGFSEIALIAVVALLVLGPERLPRVARTAGALLRRARNSWQEVRGEIERELAAEDIKRTIRDAQRDADVRTDVREAAGEIEKSVRDTAPPTLSGAPSDERR